MQWEPLKVKICKHALLTAPVPLLTITGTPTKYSWVLPRGGGFKETAEYW